METFRFLDLPLVAKRHVLYVTPFIDIFNFSCISKNCYQVVKDTVITAWCCLTLKQECCEVRICTNIWNHQFAWVFGEPGAYYKLVGEVTQRNPVTIKGLEFKQKYDDKIRNILYLDYSELPERINALFSYFSDLFHFTHYTSVHLDTSYTLFPEYRAKIAALNPRKTEGLYVSTYLITEPDIRAMMDIFTITVGIDFRVQFQGYLDCSKFDSLRCVQFERANVKPRAFLKLKTPNMYLEGVRFSEKILLRFVNKWLKSTDSKLESAIVKTQPTKNWYFIDEFHQMLQTIPWHPKRRSKVYKWKEGYFFENNNLLYEWDCSQARDIVRSDGVLASIRLTETSFEMFVWHKRFNDY